MVDETEKCVVSGLEKDWIEEPSGALEPECITATESEMNTGGLRKHARWSHQGSDKITDRQQTNKSEVNLHKNSAPKSKQLESIKVASS